MSPNQGIKAAEWATPVSLKAARSSRRLAVVLAVHVSDSVAKDRLGWSVVEPTLAENRGTLVHWTGCNLLAVFDLPEDAVRCAVVLRNLLYNARGPGPTGDRLTLRFGVELGELLVGVDSVSGEAVNISEQLAVSALAGEIYISGSVHAQISSRLACKYRLHGESALDGIAHPVRIYSVSPLPVFGGTRAKLTHSIEAIAATVAVIPERAFCAMRGRVNALVQTHIPEDRGRKIRPSSAHGKLVFEGAAMTARVIIKALHCTRATIGRLCWSLVVLFWRFCVMRGPSAWA
jgi:hypothetical protein